MLELLQKFYGNLPEGAKQAPAGALLIIALVAGMHGDWVFGRTYDAYVKQCEVDKNELKGQVAEYKTIAFNSVGFLTERAKQSAKINEQATSPPRTSPNAKPKPVVATVKVPVTPVTAQEKKDIEKPRDAEPATLAKSLEASKKVLQKADIANAEPVKKP